jgi:membrane-bound lytic murein transglycosylase B
VTLDLLADAPTRVVRSRSARVGQAAAAAVTALAVVAAGGWPLSGGNAVERLVPSASAQAPELDDTPLDDLLSGADDRRSPNPAVGTGPAVSTTSVTAVQLVDGPPGDPAGAERAMTAYRNAAGQLGVEQPGCRLSWGLLAGIGLVESNHGAVFGGSLDDQGKAVPPILGPRLDGNGFALIRDTDGGLYDGDLELDRAAGPMQFIPGTWKRWGSDGDGDGVADPQDVDDAALAAGRYLCASGARLDQPAGLIRAVFSYNHSYDYVRLVLTVAARYLGVDPATLGVGSLPAPTPPPPAAEPAPAPPPGEQPPPADGQPAPQQPAPGQPAPAPAPAPDPGGTTPPEQGAPPSTPEEPAPAPTEPAPPDCTVVPTGPDADPACPLVPGTEPSPAA